MNWQPLHNELALWPATGRKPVFWWRDDDAISDTPKLRTLLSVVGQIPVVLAVIPAQCDHSLKAVLAAYPALSVIQHGWNHTKHLGQTSEYPPARDAVVVYNELKAGADRLSELFGVRFVRAFAPPFHGWSSDFTALLEVIGMTGFTVRGTGPAGPIRSLKNVNCHVAPIVWSSPPTLGDPDTYIAAIVAELQQRRLSGSTAPIGILTHHLAHDAVITGFIGQLVAHLAPSVTFVGGPSILGP